MLAVGWLWHKDHEKRTHGQQWSDAATHLLEFASVLRSSQEIQNRIREDIERVRMQHILAGLWDLRDTDETFEGIAESLREYLQSKGVSLDRTIVTDPALHTPR